MADFLWDPHRQEQDLWFREACDAAAELAARPVSRRVLRRLAEAQEARSVWGRVAGESGAESSVVFFEKLVTDDRWKQLVQETVDRERRRAHARAGVLRDVRHRLRGFLGRLVPAGGR